MLKKYSHIIFITLFSSLVCWFEFFTKSWTYFLLDYVLFPINQIKNWFFETSIFWLLNDFFTIIFWYKFYSKLQFFLIVFFTWYLWYLYSKQLIENIFNKDFSKYKFIWILWSIFFMINPFFYERMITQPWVFLAILFLWYWIYFLFKTLFEGKNINYLLTWIFFWLWITLSPHTIFMIFLIYLVFFIITKQNIKNYLMLIFSWVLSIILNLNWFIWWFLFWNNNTINYVWTINQANIDNFFTNSIPNLWLELTNLLLYWFWWERYNYFYSPSIANEKWYFAWFFILLIILFWLYKIFKSNKKIFSFLIIVWFISFILWIWTKSNTFWFISQFLFDNLPYYIWLREPQKWIWVLMICYSFWFIAWSFYLYIFLQNFLKIKYFPSIFIIIVFLFLHSWSPNVIFWFQRQLFISNYPVEYFDFKNDFKNFDWKILVFPWHSYIWCNYTKWRIVPNLSKEFFKPLVLTTSDNIEIWTLYTNSDSQTSKDIEKFLQNKDYLLLKKHEFTNILFLDKCADFKNYEFLEKDPNLQKVYNSTNLKFYQIK